MNDSKNISIEDYNRIYGSESISKDNTDPVTWAYMNRPNSQRYLTFDEFKEMLRRNSNPES